MDKFIPAGLLALVLAIGAGFTLDVQADDMRSVSQKGRKFQPSEIEIKRGETVHVANDDEFTHHVFVKSDGFNFDSGEKDPGESVDVTFPAAGVFDVQCAIHPKMHLAVTVK